MRVLHLTPEFPWPVTSGAPLRTLSQLRIIASFPEVESIALLSIAEENVSAADVRVLEGAVEKLRVVPPIFHPIHLFDHKRYVPRVVALRLLGVPYLAGKWESRKFRRALRREFVAAPFDIVYIDHLGLGRYLPDIKAECPSCRTVLEEHNVESDFFKQFAAEKSGAKKIVAKAEYVAARKFERRLLREVDAVVAISIEDARQIKTLAGVDAHVVPLVVTFERKARPRRGRPHFCYTGGLRWRPNVLGLDWFCQKVWPLVRQRVPDATFEIAGTGLRRDASGRLPVPDQWKGPGIETVGFLEDLEPLYARSRGMLAPIIGGSGVRVKLLEGLRAGIPVVTTSDGALGLPLQDGKEALISSDPEGFAERVERLVKDDALQKRLPEAGYAYLESHHSLAIAQRVMKAALGIRGAPIE
jgi:glycosyltransferase involved in cell wall biosynthesis